MEKMPLIFVGHGSPMNAIEDNEYTKGWTKIAQQIPRPRAIIMFSAHWITHGEMCIASGAHPPMIYDMTGFPPELYEVKYTPSGSPSLAERIQKLLSYPTKLDPARGIDHGIWSVLRHMYPAADIPLVMISLDYYMAPKDLRRIGEDLQILRNEGILLMGTGNIVHNLRFIDWGEQATYPWLTEFDERVVQATEAGPGSKEFESLYDFKLWGVGTELAHPTFDHFLPIFPLMGAVSSDDTASFFTPGTALGSISMRSIMWS